MKDEFFNELDKCKSRLDVYNLIELHFNQNSLIGSYLINEFLNHMTFEVPELINVLKEAYEFIENNINK